MAPSTDMDVDFAGLLAPYAEATARELDVKYSKGCFRSEFVFPTRSQLQNASLDDSQLEPSSKTAQSTYLVGNSLGLQPVRTQTYINRFLQTWATQGVYGHFKTLSNSFTKPWMNLDEQASAAMAPIVGAEPSEVAIMQTLTANLHLLLSSFYRPTKDKYKILIEGKAFPSDHFAVQSHLAHHGHTCADALVVIESSDPTTHSFSTEHICKVIEKHADSTALVLLPGVQFYTGQLLDIQRITRFAHDKGVLIGWDLAHAAGNAPLQLHDWNVDFAAWCTYKYLNAGPGSIGALFVHERHGKVEHPRTANDTVDGGLEAERMYGFRHRLSGWWGSSKASRFDMNNVFMPIEGAAGWQLSNPSVFDTTSVLASLSVFAQTDMAVLRWRSVLLTGYLEFLLLNWPAVKEVGRMPYVLLTPREPEQRGAQISIKLNKGLLNGVLKHLEEEGVCIDERKPDVIRVAPAPIYNNFSDVWRFVDVMWAGLKKELEWSRA